MRHALPIWYCLDYETQAKLSPLLAEPDNIPPCLWQEWPAIEFVLLIVSDADKEYLRLKKIGQEMERAPSRSRA